MTTTMQRLGLAIVGFAFALAAWLYPRLPDPMPTHWSWRGEADGYLPRPIGAFVMPLAMLITHALFVVYERRAARNEGAPASARVLSILHGTLLAFLLLTSAVVFLVATGASIDLPRLVYAGLGLLLAILGNYLGKLRRNRWIGIRTPWTLADDEIWARTHRLAGPLFIVGGAFLTIAALRGHARPAAILALITMTLVPSVYSYLLSRRQRG